MNYQEALEIINRVLCPKSLSYIQKLVLSQSWEGKTYKEIAQESGYAEDYIKEVGSNLWNLLSEALEERVTKKNLPLILAQQATREQLPRQELAEKPVIGETSAVGAGSQERVNNLSGQQPPSYFSLLSLPRRQFFEQVLEQQHKRLSQEGFYLSRMPISLLSLSLILCRVDGWLNYRQNWDERTTEACLQQIALSLQQNLKRPGDLLAYYDEATFAILLPQTNAKGAVHLANTLRSQVKNLELQNLDLRDVSATIGMSAGVTSLIANSANSPEFILITAVEALEQAELLGGDRVAYKPCPSKD